jgi:uncharacterized protein (TIGR02118 family)
VVKVLFILRRRPDLDAAAFEAYWKDTHGPLAAKVPGLRRYVQSIPFPDPYGDPLPADGVDELQFDSIEDMQRALATPEGRAMLADIPNFLDKDNSGPIIIAGENQLV